MCFEHPVPAMRNIHQTLKPDGEPMFMVWRDIADNPRRGLPREVMRDSVEDAMRCQFAPGPAGEVFREAGEEAERQRPEIEAALRKAPTPFEQGGRIVMGSTSWTIVARKPQG